MLLLTRRIGESIIIGNDITIQVLKKRGSQICLGITAPRDITIWRQELLANDHQSNRETTSLSLNSFYTDDISY